MSERSNREVDDLMVIKVQNRSRFRMPTYSCHHFNVTELETGIEIRLIGGPGDGTQVTLPDDGHKVFIENDKGDTIDSYTWPPVKRVKELRV